MKKLFHFVFVTGLCGLGACDGHRQLGIFADTTSRFGVKSLSLISSLSR